MEKTPRFSVMHNEAGALYFITDQILKLEVGRIQYKKAGEDKALPTQAQALVYAMLYTSREDLIELAEKWMGVSTEILSSPEMAQLSKTDFKDFTFAQMEYFNKQNQMATDFKVVADMLEETIESAEAKLSIQPQ